MKDITLAIVVSSSPVGQIRHNMDRMKYWILKASDQNIKMVCFPELNLTGYSTQADIKNSALSLEHEWIQELGDLAKKEAVVVLFGMIEKNADNRYFASHLAMGPKGLLGIYRKLHIAPPEKKIFSAGNEIPVFKIPECQFGIQLCYDAHFPELSSRMALNGAEIILIPHASPRGTSKEKYDSWVRHLTARAYDNSVYIVAWNQIGNNGKGLVFPGLSVVIGPDGKIIEKKLIQRENMMVTTLKSNELSRIRNNKMHFFLPHRRPELY